MTDETKRLEETSKWGFFSSFGAFDLHILSRGRSQHTTTLRAQHTTTLRAQHTTTATLRAQHTTTATRRAQHTTTATRRAQHTTPPPPRDELIWLVMISRSKVLDNDDLLRIIAEYVSNYPLAFVLTCIRFRAIYNSLPENDNNSRMVSKVGLHCWSVSLVEWAISLGCPTRKLCFYAARIGSLDSLQWLRNQDPPFPWCYPSVYAAEGGNLHVLQWLRAQEHPMDQCVCNAAAANGRLHVLQWLRAQDPPCHWDEETCAIAAQSGHLHVLQWLRTQEPPCPWDEETCAFAAQSGHLHVLQWLRTQEPPCPWDHLAFFFTDAAAYGNNACEISVSKEVYEWIRCEIRQNPNEILRLIPLSLSNRRIGS